MRLTLPGHQGDQVQDGGPVDAKSIALGRPGGTWGRTCSTVCRWIRSA